MNIYKILEKKLKNNDIHLIKYILQYSSYEECPICSKYENKLTFDYVFYENCSNKILICKNCHKDLDSCDNCKTKHKPKLLTISDLTKNIVCIQCKEYYERRCYNRNIFSGI